MAHIFPFIIVILSYLLLHTSHVYIYICIHIDIKNIYIYIHNTHVYHIVMPQKRTKWVVESPNSGIFREPGHQCAGGDHEGEIRRRPPSESREVRGDVGWWPLRIQRRMGRFTGKMGDFDKSSGEWREPKERAKERFGYSYSLWNFWASWSYQELPNHIRY